MRVNFRQGIVSHQTDTFGTPTFLQVSGGYVSVMTANAPTIVTFIHGTKDYLYTERLTQLNAWGPFGATDQWLYWQINPATGEREFGSTDLEPLMGTTPPVATIGQMWFNTSSQLWYEYNGAAWVEVIRVFACKLVGGVTPISMSINAPDFRGTQVGLEVASRSGALTFDGAGKPIRTGDRKFFTTEDQFFTGISTGARLRVGNILIPGIAMQPLHKFQVVEFSDFNEITPATPFTQLTRVYGILEEDAPTGDVVDFVTEGQIYNEAWDWMTAGAAVNDPVYIDDAGEIQLSPHIGAQMPIGTVIGPQEIMFAPRLFSQVEASVNYDVPMNYVGTITSGQFVWHMPVTRDMEFAGSASTDHQGYAEVAPFGGDAVFELYSSTGGASKVSHGTFTFGNGSKVLTNQTIVDFGVSEGDSLHLQCVTNFGMTNVSITLKGHTIVFWKP